jgi:phenol hydroxylase P2 protein
MSTETSNVFLALQANDDTIDAPDTLSVNRETVEELVGRSFDLQELHIHMISISGHVDETDDTLTLTWNH